MPTNTAGSAGLVNADSNGPHVNKAVIRYSDWVGTNNDRKVLFVLPAGAVVLPAPISNVIVKTAFNDTTGDDLDVGVEGTDDDLFASAIDLNTGSGVLLTLDDLADANRYSATARTVTANFTTAPTGDGTTGEVVVTIGYFIV